MKVLLALGPPIPKHLELILILILCLWLGALIAEVLVVRRWPIVGRILFVLGCSLIGVPLFFKLVVFLVVGTSQGHVFQFLLDWPAIYLPLLLAPLVPRRKEPAKSRDRGA